MDKEKIYFPNLNGLRFIAASLVVIHHTEQIKSFFKINNYYEVPFSVIIGRLGVVLFFVLSGFLITYLLVAEENIKGRISIKPFYVRRILRIWPLYFLIILLGLWILPNISIFILPGFGKDIIYKDLFLKIVLFVAFLPNLVLSLIGAIPYVSHTWSIGTEEQYYLVWPVILKYFRKYRVALMLFIIFSYIGIEKLLSSRYSDMIPHHYALQAFWGNFNIDCMAIGGLFAILLFKKSRYLKFLINNYLFYGVTILVCALMINGAYLPYHFESYATLFGIIILNLAANNKINTLLENRVLNYLGKISYGIYMYHPITIVLAIQIAVSINATTHWVIYLLTFTLTILIAAISYRYFEAPFLKFKVRFSKIVSGDNSKTEMPVSDNKPSYSGLVGMGGK